LVALSLVAMLGIVAIAIDGGLILDQRRQLQSAADAAALAAAVDLYLNNPINTAKQSALSVAATNRYNNDGSTNTVSVLIPPNDAMTADVTAPYNGAGYVEVVITYTPQSYFSGVFKIISPGFTMQPIKAEAVARGKLASIGDGIILLDPTGSGALTAGGNATMTVTNGPVIVDSSSATGGVTSGNHATVTASQGFYFAGNPGTNSPNFKGPISSGQTPTSDPLSYLTPPNPNSLTLQSNSALSVTSTSTLNPGVYKGGISISGNSSVTVTMNPGIYYMQGGGFSVTGQASVTDNGKGVMIFNNNGGGTIQIIGQGAVTLSPVTIAPYQGITIFQDPSSNAPITIAGNGRMNITGTFYAPATKNPPAPGTWILNVSGNGDNLGSQYITWDLNVAGNGAVNLNYNANSSAKTKQYGLVQ
jgi:hypothetical protein